MPVQFKSSLDPAYVSSESATDLSCKFADVGCHFQGQTPTDVHAHDFSKNANARHLELMRDRTDNLDDKIQDLQAEMAGLVKDISNLKLVTNSDDSLKQLKLLIKTFPLCNLKNSQYMHATQLQVAELKEQLDKEKVLREKQSEEIGELKEAIEKLKISSSHKNTSNYVPEHFEGVANFANSIGNISKVGDDKTPEPMDHDSGIGSWDSMSSVSTVSSQSTPSLSSLAPLSETDVKSLMDRMTSVEKKIDEVKKEQERWKQLERFVMHLHERIKSLDCGRSGKLIWKISGFSTIFENAKSVESRKKKDIKVDPNTPCDFCSPLFYTSSHGYLLYMRLYPYGCDSAVGKFMSLFVALSPGEYDGILPWPFRSTLEISLLSQEEPNEKWTQTIVPGGNNMACFQRPSSKSGNLSVGILHFIVHSKLYGQSSSPYIQNDTIYIEVTVKEPENVNVGPSKPKAPRAAPVAANGGGGSNTSTRASPDYRPNSGSTITLMSSG